MPSSRLHPRKTNSSKKSNSAKPLSFTAARILLKDHYYKMVVPLCEQEGYDPMKFFNDMVDHLEAEAKAHLQERVDERRSSFFTLNS